MTEDLKSQLDYFKDEPKYLRKVIDELEQENKELKIKLSSTKCYLCGEGFLTPEGAELYEEKNNYRSVLEEIREIVNQSCNNCKYNKDDITCSIGDCGEGKLRIIENKINEGLNLS